MLVKHSFDQRFINLIDRMRSQYSEEMLELTGIGAKQLDINSYSRHFFGTPDVNTADKTIDANANVSDSSVNAWETELKKPIMKLNALYQLWKSAEAKHGIKRANKMIEHEIKGSIRIHDAWLWNKPYCFAFSLNKLVQEGMPFYDKIKIGEVKHFDSFINLSLQFLCFASNQVAGAVAFPDFFVYAEYFIRKDYGENWHEDEAIVSKVEQLFQNWIYSVNFSWRSNQSPFTNLSVMDEYWLKALFSNHYNPDYSTPNFENTMRVQKVFTNEMIRNLESNPFTFPVMTSCLLFDEDTGEYKDEEFFDWVCEVQSKTALFNMFQDTDINALSSCCRLRNSLDVNNNEYTNSFGVGGLSIGSHRVVSLNLPQIAYESNDWGEFTKLVEYKTNLSQDILDIHRDTIQNHIDNGRLPLYDYGYMNLEKQFSTIGFMGMYEAIEIMGLDITSEEGSKRAKGILELINNMNNKRTLKDGHIRNIEQIPGESAASTFVKKDQLIFDGKVKYPLYSNQYIPLVKDVDMVDRIRMQGEYDKSVGGGSILHINFDQTLTKDQFAEIMKYSAKVGVVYWAINYGLSQCKTCGKTFVGKYDKSPCHNADVDRYLRVVGFLTRISDWTSARQDEYEYRQFYNGYTTLA